jgi:hypothetical protein
VIDGSVGASPTTSITGTIPTSFTISGGTVQSGGATAAAGQSELGTAITALEGMSTGATAITGGILGGKDPRAGRLFGFVDNGLDGNTHS